MIKAGFIALIVIIPCMPVTFVHFFFRKPTPGRPRYQLHLSTCIVLMAVASILLGLNVMPSIQDSEHSHSETSGWPMISTMSQLDTESDGETIGYQHFDRCGFAIDVLLALDLLAAAAICCEWWIGISSNQTKRSKLLRPQIEACNT